VKHVRADRRVGLLLGGILLLTFVAIGATVALPAADPAIRSTRGARTFAGDARRGMVVYRNEGCWYCHTQYTRETAQDKAWGKPLGASAYANQSPALLGLERLGPDLTHLGSRFPDAAALASFLEDPGEDRPRTSMPQYAYLSERDLRALAAYLLSFR
jgi:cbb3-type cytochrome oxidase cytochrome c subunit